MNEVNLPKDDASSSLTNEQGGITAKTACMRKNRGYLYVMLNAGCVPKDMDHLCRNVNKFQRKDKPLLSLSSPRRKKLMAVRGLQHSSSFSVRHVS
jgi:hypothetical protein